jgi:hypothetical protein
MKTGLRRMGFLSRGMSLLFVLSMLASPLAADPLHASSIRSAALKAAATGPGGAPGRRAFTQEAGGAATSSSKPFLKTRKGAVAVALMAGAVVWIVVSHSKDAVHSPARQ